MTAGPPNAKAIFDEAVEIADPEARRAYLDRACVDDAAVRAKVEALLQAYGEAGSFLEKPAVDAELTDAFIANRDVARPLEPRPITEGPGSCIGPYKLLQEIGEGGMGVVYMAEQEKPVRRRVALKIIKPGMDSKQVIARFEAERQALALMDHQNIARVLDAGTTETGRPYFVMELVHGVPITKYCDDARLTPRERLELFVPVCQAIQHAHQKGIIHRDIKPSNVLVTLYDGKPVAKVIDFGVAKATDQRLTERTMFTQYGSIVGTLEYMSPEQAEMSALGVDTRSDVYSLGVLLYELLTGTTPLERASLREAGYAEILRRIKEEEPPKPSTRLSASRAGLPSISAQRKTDPAKLAKLVRGELDWIAMKCLEKDRTRRYDSASGLARDIERYLHDEAVEACPPSARYRLSKFVRKHRAILGTAVAFAVLLVACTVLSALMATWAATARKEADRQRIASDEAKREAIAARAEADEQRDEARLIAYASGMGLAQRAWEENDVVRARELLEEVPKEAAGRNLRGFEWFYLSRLCHPDELTLEGHAGSVWSVAFSPDGQRLASGSGDGTVKIWDSATGKELYSFKRHASFVTSVAFSPDGQRLASGSDDKTVKIWDSAIGKELFTLRGHTGQVWSVAFSPDGQRLASGCEDGTVKIWDSASGKELFGLKGHAVVVRSVAFSPEGQRLASGSNDKTVKIWDSATGKELFALRGHAGEVTSVAFSPDGKRLASAGWDQTIKIWDSATGKELFDLKGHAGGVLSLAFSPDGQRLASGSIDQTVKIWDSATGKELIALKGHAAGVLSLAFAPDGQRLASASYDQTVKIWDSAIGKEVFALKGHAAGVLSLAFSPDGQRLASGSIDQTLKIWDSATGKELFNLKGHAGYVSSVAFSTEGQRLASGSNDKTVKIWDSATGKELFALKGHAGAVWSVAFSPDGRRLASASDDKTVMIWDSGTGKELFALKGHAAGIPSLAFSPDGQRLASGSIDQTVKIWDSATGKELFDLKGHTGYVSSVAFSPEGRRLASGSRDKTVKIWDTATGKELFALKGHAGEVTRVAFSPDGQRLASAGWDQTIKIWDSATGKELFALKGHAGFVRSMAFSPDGKRLASANQDGSLHLWETTSVPPEVQDHRAANQMVSDLFGQMVLRADVVERLRTLPGMSPSRRQEAITVAQTYPENPLALNDLAKGLVRLPGGEMSGYGKALRYSEEMCRLEPKNGLLLNTLGVAYYRVGDYEKALETLVRSNQINNTEFKDSIPADLAFLAMTQQRLGHAKEAQAELQHLRERMKDPRWAQDDEAPGLLREAEALLGKTATPGGK